MTIIDAHSHLASMRITPVSFIEGAARNHQVMLESAGIHLELSVLIDRFSEHMQDDQGDNYVSLCREAGVKAAVMLCPDFSYILKDCPVSAEENLTYHRDMARHHGGFLNLFAGVDPRWGSDGVRLFEIAVRDWGFGGLKLYPPCGYSPSDPMLDPFYEICAAHKLPVVIHIGPTSPVLEFAFARPFLVDSAAARFPGVNFILAHGATCFTEECMMLASCRPNVYVDVSGFQAGRNAFSVTGPGIFSWGLSHKLIFGTDWPVLQSQMSYGSCIEYFTSVDGPMGELSVAQQRLVMSNNASRILGTKLSTDAGSKRWQGLPSVAEHVDLKREAFL